MTKHPRWILAAVCLLGLMSTVGVSMPYPILAPIFAAGPVDHFTHFGGLDPQVLMGIALAANPLGILVGSLFVGPLSDRYGRRAVLTVTLLATLAGYLFTAAALGARHYPLFVLARFVTGLTESNTAVARALLADMHEELDRTQSFAWLNACLYAGWLLGPLVGGLTLPLGEPVPFVLAGAMMLPCLAILALGIPGAPVHPGPLRLLRAMREQNVLGLLRLEPALAWLAALQLAYALGINSLYEFGPLWLLQNAGLDSRGIAFVTAVQCAVMTLASILVGRWGGWLSGGRHPLQRASLVALAGAVGLALLAVLPGPAGIATIVAMGLPPALYNAVVPAWVSERFAAHGQGRAMGLLSTVFCVANVVIALAGGWIALLSVRWIMGLGGLFCIAAALLTLQIARRELALQASRDAFEAARLSDAWDADSQVENAQ
jgi:MFS family permease